jgi:2'-5' RNA ligase
MHRIFIAINLPEDIKKELISYQEKWPELPVRWTRKENLHITLVFIGTVNDEEVLEICKIVRAVAQKHKSFPINFKRVCYGPPGKTPPRMVWIEGEKSREIGGLQQDLENSISNINIGKSEKREYAPHLTLGRIKEWEFKKIEPEERPEVETDINLNFDVNSIEIMESELRRIGPEYTVLESCPFTS